METPLYVVPLAFGRWGSQAATAALLYTALEDAAAALTLFEEATALPSYPSAAPHASGAEGCAAADAAGVLEDRMAAMTLDHGRVERTVLRGLHAKSFVKALALVGRVVGNVTSWPAVKDVRDSGAHADERAQGRGRFGPIEPREHESAGVRFGSGTMVLGRLVNNVYGWTAESGEYASVEVSIRTLAQAARDVDAWVASSCLGL